jgi:hypothetical protein
VDKFVSILLAAGRKSSILKTNNDRTRLENWSLVFDLNFSFMAKMLFRSEHTDKENCNSMYETLPSEDTGLENGENR